jgi:hypothetical protein
MKILLALVAVALNGCAAYTVASTTTYLATDKTLTDHAVTQITPMADCNITNIFKNLYYCEVRDISRTYNRHSY